MNSYFTSIIPSNAGGYSCFIFDFQGAATQGDDLEEAVFMAEDILSIWAEEFTRERKEMPKPSSIEAIKKLTLEKIAEHPEDYARPCEPLYQLLKMPNMDTKPVKVTVSFPKNVLEFVDKEADKLGMTRSGFLAKSAMSYSASL